MEFHKYLKDCRERHHKTQEELVSELYSYDKKIFENLDTVTLSRWERHTTTPNYIKKLSMLKYFQGCSKEALPCWDTYSTEEIENLVCAKGLCQLLGKTKHVILNFPSAMMQIDDLKVYPIKDIQKSHTVFEINMDIYHRSNDSFTALDIEQFETWAMHPENLFLVCEYKDTIAGLFFSLRLKPEAFEKILNFTMKKSELTEADFASSEEEGSDLLLSFYAINNKVATVLLVRHYAYLIAGQKKISEVGVAVSLDEVEKTLSNMNLELYQSKVLQNNMTLKSYRQTLDKVLATEYVVKMLFSEA